jgi:NOL1/NOP2/fmu family ribosome biogenesis protein
MLERDEILLESELVETCVAVLFLRSYQSERESITFKHEGFRCGVLSNDWFKENTTIVLVLGRTWREYGFEEAKEVKWLHGSSIRWPN